LNVAAIDIGSNAARLYICSFFNDGEDRARIKILEFVRVPVRLGDTVFQEGSISAEKEQHLQKMLQSFKMLMELFGVEDYRACATSAMREAVNGADVTARLFNQTGIQIEVISGQQEAELIYKAHQGALEEGKKVLFVDVGGGSTEISLLHGENQLASRSFDLGGVRILDGRDDDESWKEMKSWLKNVIKPLEPDYALGTGGNINKMFDLMNLKQGKFATQKQLATTYDYIKSFPLEQRIKNLGLNPDRADVILPSCDIYMAALKAAAVNKITISGLGLKEGIVAELLDKHYQTVIRRFQGNDRFSVH
jgi:exopolyphosphatase / guanosine-5'-triphosphate,3'-diphosphate pyrophosphatase